MKNETQVQRYQQLLHFIEQRFQTDIKIPDIEAACHYSYRNINRIFQALQNETIGKHIKRLRLEQAAQQLKYTQIPITDIAFEVGFADLAAFSKAFKQYFACAPSVFRQQQRSYQHIQAAALNRQVPKVELAFELEQLPALHLLGLSYRGAYDNLEAIQETWEQLASYAAQLELLDEESIFMAEILDDDEITEHIHCRYTASILLEKPLSITPKGFFFQKTLPTQSYVKFVHQGPHEHCPATYQAIYAAWTSQVQLEFAAAPTLEFYLNDSPETPKEELLTEIYIPVL